MNIFSESDVKLALEAPTVNCIAGLMPPGRADSVDYT